MSEPALPLDAPPAADMPAWIAEYRDPLGEDEAPVKLLTALHTFRHLPPTRRLARPWTEDIGDGWVFHFNGQEEPVLIATGERTGIALIGRHLLVLRHGAPLLIIDKSGGWGQPADRDAFTARLAIFLEQLKGEVA